MTTPFEVLDVKEMQQRKQAEALTDKGTERRGREGSSRTVCIRKYESRQSSKEQRKMKRIGAGIMVY